MENPEPLREHHELDQLAGHFAGPERMHPSPWNPTAVKAEAVTDARIALDGFAVVQDYEQRLEDGSRFAGHGVFRYDAPSDTYEMHWFDSTGSAPRIFRGGFADRMLVLTARAGDGWQRLTYDFNLAGGYRFKLETSDDGNDWKLALEGDNFEDRASQAQVAASEKRKMTGRKAAASNSSASKATAKKTPARKAAAKKATAKKAPAKKTTAKKATAKKATAKKAPAKKATAKTGTRKVSARAGAKKTAKTAPASRPAKKTATGTAKKRAAAGTTAKKTAKKAAAKTSGVRTAAARKTAAGKARAKKAGSRTTVAAIERKRRQGTASKKIAAKKTSARGNGRAAGAPVSQKNVKGGAKRAPQMLTVRKTSTRTGGHRTAAKGARMR